MPWTRLLNWSLFSQNHEQFSSSKINLIYFSLFTKLETQAHSQKHIFSCDGLVTHDCDHRFQTLNTPITHLRRSVSTRIRGEEKRELFLLGHWNSEMFQIFTAHFCFTELPCEGRRTPLFSQQQETLSHTYRKTCKLHVIPFWLN